jgi:CitMHS family citrate-Mg2+:H+ or citrate-Ca2+:H+ symporter
MLTILAYLMIICFMAVIMTKKMSAFTALTTVPIVFGIIAILTGVTAQSVKDSNGDSVIPLKLEPLELHLKDIGELVSNGLGSVATTGIMLLFAILYFSTMLDAGMFDPITSKMIRFAKGDPTKVLMATAIVAAAVSLNGDGTTTTLICCAAFLPIYKRLNMNLMNLAVLVILQNTIMNLLPWGGPTARAMSVLGVGADILTYLLPGMILSLAYMIFFVARSMGKKEHARLGTTELTDAEIDELTTVTDEETLKCRRPQNWYFNMGLTIVLIAWLVAGSFIPALEMAPAFLFLIFTAIALLVNYPVLKDQSSIIGKNGGDAVQVIILVFGAGVLMGIFNGTGMADAVAQNLTTIIPSSFGKFWQIVVAVLSAPGTFFISNDGWYYGVLPALAKAGNAYGFSNMELAVASLMGQAFHLLSPLVAFIYLLLRLTGQDMGEWQIESGKYALGIFAIFMASFLVISMLGFFPHA